MLYETDIIWLPHLLKTGILKNIIMLCFTDKNGTLNLKLIVMHTYMDLYILVPINIIIMQIYNCISQKKTKTVLADLLKYDIGYVKKQLYTY